MLGKRESEQQTPTSEGPEAGGRPSWGRSFLPPADAQPPPPCSPQPLTGHCTRRLLPGKGRGNPHEPMSCENGSLACSAGDGARPAEEESVWSPGLAHPCVRARLGPSYLTFPAAVGPQEAQGLCPWLWTSVWPSVCPLKSQD